MTQEEPQKDIADVIAKGLAAERAPEGFTDRVMKRIPIRVSEAAPPPSPAAPPAPFRWRRFLAVAAATWGIVFVGAIALDGNLTRRAWAPGPVVARRASDRDDPRSRWVKLDLLADLKQANLIDGVLASGNKQGYTFEAFWDGEDPRRWWVIASPASPKAGDRYFYVDDSGIIRFSTDGVPTENSTAIGG